MKKLKKLWAFLLTAALTASSLAAVSVNASAADIEDHGTASSTTLTFNAAASTATKTSAPGLISAKYSDVASGLEYIANIGNDLYFLTDNDTQRSIYRIDKTVIENWRKTGKLKATKIKVDSEITKHSDWGYTSLGDFSNSNYAVLVYVENDVYYLLAVKYDAAKNRITSYYKTTNPISLTPDGYISETNYDSTKKVLTINIISPEGKKLKTHKFDFSEYEGQWFGFSGGDRCIVTKRLYVGDKSKDGSGWDGAIYMIDKTGKKTTLTKTAARTQVKGTNYFAYSPVFAIAPTTIYSFENKKYYDIFGKEICEYTEGKKSYELSSFGKTLYGTKAVACYSRKVSEDKTEYKYALVDISTGKFLSKKYNEMHTHDNGKTYLICYSDDKWGYLDSKGKELAKFDDAGAFYGNGKYAPVMNKGRVYLINRNMKQVTKSVKMSGDIGVSTFKEELFCWYDGEAGRFMTYR